MMKKLLLVAVCATLTFSIPALADTHYVSPDGSKVIATSHPIMLGGRNWTIIAETNEGVIRDLLGNFNARYLLGMLMAALAVLLGGLLPLALVLVGFAADGAVAAVTAVLAAALAMVGIFIERWLFFAEATHKVTLYYGAESA